MVFQVPDAAGKRQHHQTRHVGSQSAGLFSHVVQATKLGGPEPQLLWRTWKAVPARGQIGIFNRSHYEEVLVVKVHPELLAAQRIPDVKVNKAFWQSRYDDINEF